MMDTLRVISLILIGIGLAIMGWNTVKSTVNTPGGVVERGRREN